MTEEPKNDNNLVVIDDHGDVISQDNGVKLLEKESYERVIEGLKISADAAAHIAFREPEHMDYWHKWRFTLDNVRRAAMHISGLELTMKFEATTDPRGEPMPWRTARDRFRDGLKQASGGMSQLATCHRGDLVYARMARDLGEIQQKVSRATVAKTKRAMSSGRLWIPDNI